MSELYEDIYFGDINQKYADLASMTSENWNIFGKGENSVLKNYLTYTYKKLGEESKIIKNKEYGLFNTGLFDTYDEPIYAYFELNKNPNGQKYYLKKFLNPYELGNMGISSLPERANYFDKPELLIFDVRCQINVQYDHILDDPDNIERIPNEIKSAKNIQNIFIGAIESMKKKVAANYKMAVPQYYSGKIQLLLPLCLVDPNKPDLALVVSKNSVGNYYQGHTCLTLEMAYNNARLIAKPESNWLQP